MTVGVIRLRTTSGRTRQKTRGNDTVHLTSKAKLEMPQLRATSKEQKPIYLQTPRSPGRFPQCELPLALGGLGTELDGLSSLKIPANFPNSPFFFSPGC